MAADTCPVVPAMAVMLTVWVPSVQVQVTGAAGTQLRTATLAMWSCLNVEGLEAMGTGSAAADVALKRCLFAVYEALSWDRDKCVVTVTTHWPVARAVHWAL